jgi:predicted AAA+ superfamily ATPase
VEKEIRRHAQGTVEELLQSFPIVQIQGARRTGKSTLALRVSEGREHLSFTLDDEDVLRSAISDPRGFVQQTPHGLMVIDELRRAPSLMLAIKAEVDANPRPGRFLLTGSSNLLRSTKMPDSLAGRAASVWLSGFSQGELNDAPDDFAAWITSAGVPDPRKQSSWTRQDYMAQMLAGGYPEARAITAQNRRRWFDNYVERLLDRDVADLGRRVSSKGLARILRMIGANQSGELVKSHLASAVGLPESSVNAYLDVLDTLYLTTDLQPWRSNLTSREVGRHKLSVTDSGLALAISRTSAEALALPTASAQLGAALEAFVVAELAKQRVWTSAPFDLYHFRDSTGLEVDIVMEFDDGRVFLIEVKASQTYRPEFTKGIRTLAERLGRRFVGGAVLSTSPTAFRYADHIWGLPIASIWEE